jgi:hypothetical protein
MGEGVRCGLQGAGEFAVLRDLYLQLEARGLVIQWQVDRLQGAPHILTRHFPSLYLYIILY